MTYTVCDKCGKSLRYNPMANAIYPEYSIKKYNPPYGNTEVDLCSDCQKAFDAWLNTPKEVEQDDADSK